MRTFHFLLMLTSIFCGVGGAICVVMHVMLRLLHIFFYCVHFFYGTDDIMMLSCYH